MSGKDEARMTATTLKEISDHINHMTFRRKLFGGVDERDVWRQIQMLDDDYRNLFKIMSQYYQGKMKSMKQEANAAISKK